LCCREFARRQRVDLPGLWAVAWRTALILVLGRVFFLPFHQNYASAYFGAELWKGSRTPLWAYLLIHGFFLFVLTSYLIGEFFKGQGHNALVRSLRLHLRTWRRHGRMQRLFDHIAHPSSGYRLMTDISLLAFVFVIVAFLINHVIGLVLTLTLFTALLLFSTRPDPLRQFLLCMIGLGLVFTALVEVVVLKGDISRMNTVFKFYLQVWVLWAVASAAVLPKLGAWLKPVARTHVLRLPELLEGSAWTPEVARQFERLQGPSANGWSRRWWWAFGILLAACFLYPLTAAPVRVHDRFDNSTSETIDGTAYMKTSVYLDDNRPVTLSWDQQAFEWLKQHVHGIPTILEANTPLYRWGSRVSIYTGLPTVIGWDWHQKQQRSILPGETIDHRIADVQTIYNSTDLQQTENLLKLYNVKYIYVGPLEKIYYDANGLNKFDQSSDLWKLIYQNEQVKIYQVQ
jgi:YYY domain-containing protein